MIKNKRDLTPQDGSLQVYDEGRTLAVVEATSFSLYHKSCGGLLASHGSAQNLAPACACPRRSSSKPDHHQVARRAVQQALADVYVRLGVCQSIDDVRKVIQAIAAKDEMRDQNEATRTSGR